MTIRLLIPVGLVVLDIILNVLGTIICVHCGSVTAKNLKKVIFETNALISKMKVNLFTKTTARDRHAILPLDSN